MQISEEKLIQIENYIREVAGKEAQLFVAVGVPVPGDKNKEEVAMIIKGGPRFLSEVTIGLLEQTGAEMIKIPMPPDFKNNVPKINPKDIN